MQDNFTYGIYAIVLQMKSMLASLIFHEITLGFGFGFLAATGIYVILLAEEPAHIPLILAHKPNVCFEKIASRSENGTYQTSYTEFQKMYDKIKVLVYSSILAFLVLASIVLLS